MDFSYAVLLDLEAARAIAAPPYPVTWIGVDNASKLARILELGHQRLTPTASSQDVCSYYGWLIDTHPQQPTAHRATYICALGQGPLIAPFSFGWDQEGGACPWSDLKPDPTGATPYMVSQAIPNLNEKIFGVRLETQVAGAWLTVLPGGTEFDRHAQWAALMDEIMGELRYVFGLFAAMAAGKVTHGESQMSSTSVLLPSRKPLLMKEHRSLVIHLNPRSSPQRHFLRVAGGIRKRWHEVRGHWRTYRNADGSTRKRVEIKAHERGDARLGRITKDYRVTT